MKKRKPVTRKAVLILKPCKIDYSRLADVLLKDFERWKAEQEQDPWPETPES